jgi:hypothetical protein
VIAPLSRRLEQLMGFEFILMNPISSQIHAPKRNTGDAVTSLSSKR